MSSETLIFLEVVFHESKEQQIIVTNQVFKKSEKTKVIVGYDKFQ